MANAGGHAWNCLQFSGLHLQKYFDALHALLVSMNLAGTCNPNFFMWTRHMFSQAWAQDNHGVQFGEH